MDGVFGRDKLFNTAVGKPELIGCSGLHSIFPHGLMNGRSNESID